MKGISAARQALLTFRLSINPRRIAYYAESCIPAGLGWGLAVSHYASHIASGAAPAAVAYYPLCAAARGDRIGAPFSHVSAHVVDTKRIGGLSFYRLSADLRLQLDHIAIPRHIDRVSIRFHPCYIFNRANFVLLTLIAWKNGNRLCGTWKLLPLCNSL